jgi:hypothetical protein
MSSSTNPLAAFQQFVAQQKDPYGLDRIRAGLASKGMKEWSEPSAQKYIEAQKALGSVGEEKKDLLEQFKKIQAEGGREGFQEDVGETVEQRLAAQGFSTDPQGRIVYTPGQRFDIGNKGVMLGTQLVLDPETGKVVEAGPAIDQRQSQGQRIRQGIMAVAPIALAGLGGPLAGLTNTLTSSLSGLGSLAPVAGKAITSGLVGGSLAKLGGGKFGQGFKAGAVSGGIGAGMNALAPDLFKGLGSLETPAKSLTTSALTAKALGRKFDPAAAIQGAAINTALGEGAKAAGVDPKAFNQFMQFAAPMIAARRRPGGG